MEECAFKKRVRTVSGSLFGGASAQQEGNMVPASWFAAGGGVRARDVRWHDSRTSEDLWGVSQLETRHLREHIASHVAEHGSRLKPRWIPSK